MAPKKSKSDPDPAIDHKDEDAASEGMRQLYAREKILSAFKEFGVDARFEVRELMRLVKSRKSSRPVKLRALERLQDLRYEVRDTRLSSRVYKRTPGGPPIEQEPPLPAEMLAEAARVELE